MDIDDSVRNHYLGKNIQNELMAKYAVMKLFKRCGKKVYSIILDCTRDVSHTDRMIFHNADKHSGDNEEYFSGFIPIEEKLRLKN
jgi:hypothetical protein